MTSDGSPDFRLPFRVGETVVFFPAVTGPTSLWLAWDYAVIDDIDDEAGTFGSHFVGEPGIRHAQGFENIVRPTPAYHAWCSAWESAYRKTRDEGVADAETEDLARAVLAEHPEHGPRLDCPPRPRRGQP